MVSSNNNTCTKGFLLVDVLIGLMVASIVTVAFLESVVSAVRYASMQAKAVQAELLAIEMLEVVRELETSNWSELRYTCTSDDPCHPAVNSDDEWFLDGGTTTTHGFDHALYVEEVRRDPATHAIDPSGDVFDDSKKVTANVVWSTYGQQRGLTLKTYVYEQP